MEVGNEHLLQKGFFLYKVLTFFKYKYTFLICVYTFMYKMCIYVGNESFWYTNHRKDTRDAWENECREQIMPVSEAIPFSPQLCLKWLSARFLSSLTWLNSDREKTTVLLAFENLIVVRGNSRIFTQETMSRDKAISGPQAEESLLVDGVYVLAKK